MRINKDYRHIRNSGILLPMKHSIFLFVLLLISLMLLSGCNYSSGPYLFNPYSGTRGLSVNFLSNAPPNEIYSGMPYKIGFELGNYGAYDINNAYLVLGTDDFGGSSLVSKKIEFNLKGKKTTHGFWGEKKFQLVDATAPKLDEKKESSILLSYLACYPYTTKAQIPICVDTNPFSQGRKACIPKPVTLDSQGAPIAVTSVEQSTIPVSEGTVQLRFRITVDNKGQGTVTLKDSYSKLCNNQPMKREEINSIEVSAELGSEKLTCTPERIMLSSSQSGDEGVFICVSKEVPMKDAYKTLLIVNLDYGYILSGVKEISVYNII